MASYKIITALAFALALSAMADSRADGLPASMMLAQSSGLDCNAIARQVAAEEGGDLLSVDESGGQCVVTVLVPASGGERPRKVTRRVSG
ncbi:hypothetical protein FE840_010210 [Peteryoungia desertarenae]|uniref:Uncharacterized protein n=1 Tax=Peteryoungia desertarenae TaxID=1813451 RepID=A0ABX6QN08_9HYPH|nr:hypothetical protein [Peteryoungia desertarenae]QLF69879.1 hypothetical protein FE840_010210 [Peteryoungia desertarenae]